VEEYDRAGYATYDNMAHAYCMLCNGDTKKNSELKWLRESTSMLLYTYVAL